MDLLTEQRRHSAAHVLAMAVLRLYPDAKLGIGPVTEDGYHYDFQIEAPIAWEQVKEIEQEMEQIIKANLPFARVMVPRDQAYQILLTRGQIFKTELMEQINEEEVSFYKTGDEFIDLCRGPHVHSTSEVGVVKLVSISEVHWKNDTQRPSLKRISGVCFADSNKLQQYLDRQQAIQTRDFRKYALEQGLQVKTHGQQIMYTPQGLNTIEAFMDQIKHEFNDYAEIEPPALHDPHLLPEMLDAMFASKTRSYRELPLKFGVQSYISLDKSQVVLGKEIDYAHYLVQKNFLAPLASGVELDATLQKLIITLEKFNLRYHVDIHVPSLDLPNLNVISEVLQRKGVSQTQIVDAYLGAQQLQIAFIGIDQFERRWEIVRIKYETQGLPFANDKGETESCHGITLMWQLESLLAYYLENDEGALPVWAAPIQLVLIPISEAQEKYTYQIAQSLEELGVRIKLDNRAETMPARIRDAELKRIPIVIVVGEKEQMSETVSLRLRNNQEIGLVTRDELFTTLREYGLRFAAE